MTTKQSLVLNTTVLTTITKQFHRNLF